MVSTPGQRIAGVVFLFLAFACLGEIEPWLADAQTKQETPAVGAGEIRGNSYRSIFFRFTYTLPDKLNPETIQAMRDKMQEGMKTVPQSDQEKFKAAQEEAGSRITWLFSASAPEFENNLKATVRVIAIDLSDLEGMSPAVALEEIMTATTEEPTFASLSPIRSRQYGQAGFAETRYRFEKVLVGKRLRFYSAKCVTLRGKYALVWHFTSGSVATLDRLLGSMNSVQFQD